MFSGSIMMLPFWFILGLTPLAFAVLGLIGMLAIF